MSVTSLDTDLDQLTLTLVADFAAPVDQVWQLWSDPRKLERWWGPPTYPATMQEHDLTPGGTVTYYMTSPDGDRYHGWWRVIAVDPPRSLQLIDGFADADGNPSADMPTTSMTLELTGHGAGTRMTLRSVYDTRDQMEQLIKMGMVEGLELAVGQMDPLLA